MVVKKVSLVKKLVFLFILLILFAASPQILAAQQETAGEDDLFEMSLEDLMEIEVVSASNKAESVRDAPSNITIVTAQQIKEWGSRDIKDVLRRVAGYTVVADRDEWVFSSRGNLSDNNMKYMILIDGHNMKSINNFGPGQIIELPSDLSNVKRIEIIKGPGSAVWGSGAMAGVINIITKDAKDLGKYQNHTSFTWGEDDTYKSNLHIGRIDEQQDMDWIMHASYARSDGTEVDQTASTTFALDSVAGQSYRTDMDRLDDSYMFQFKGNYGKWSLNSMAFNTSVFNRHYETGRGRENFYTTGKYFLETAYKDNIGDWDFQWKGFLHWNRAKFKNTKQDPSLAPPAMIRLWQDKSIGTSATLMGKLTDKLFLNSGIEYVYTRIGPDDEKRYNQTPPFAVSSRTKTYFEDNHLNSYLVFDYYLEDDLKLIFGSGANYNDDRGGDEWAFTPRVGLIWHENEKVTHKLIYNRAFLRPAVFQTTNNPNVDSEEMDQIEYINLRKIGTADVTTTLFWQKLVGFININSLSPATFQNAGEYESLGAELEISTPFRENHTLWGNASFTAAEAGHFTGSLALDRRRVDEDGEVLGHPKFAFNLGGTFRFLEKKLFIAPAVRHVVSTQYRVTAPTATLDDAVYTEAGPFTYLDLNIGYEPKENVGFYLGIHNLTDIKDDTHQSIWNGIIGQSGRYIELKVVIKF